MQRSQLIVQNEKDKNFLLDLYRFVRVHDGWLSNSDALSSPVAVNGMHNGLGYPVYFIPFIGVAKILGVLAIIIPGYPKIKEWAYAGLMFDLAGASYSIIASGAPFGNWAFMVIPIGLGLSSYFFYHKKLSELSRAEPSGHFYEDNYEMSNAKIV